VREIMMKTKYDVGDDLYIKVKVKGINITEFGNIRYIVKLPSMYVHNELGEVWEDELHHFDTEEDE
jgi:hypothetical protein